MSTELKTLTNGIKRLQGTVWKADKKCKSLMISRHGGMATVLVQLTFTNARTNTFHYFVKSSVTCVHGVCVCVYTCSVSVGSWPCLESLGYLTFFPKMCMCIKRKKKLSGFRCWVKGPKFLTVSICSTKSTCDAYLKSSAVLWLNKIQAAVTYFVCKTENSTGLAD